MKMETEHTKKVLRAIPEDKKSYKPDPKARSAHELAWHIVSAEVWFMDFVIAGRPDFPWSEPAAPPTIDAILAWYDQNYSDRLGKLKSLPADKLVVTVAFPGAPELPIIDFLNILNLHSAHHRGQLSTYLRPMGSKVPSMYGGSADEPYQRA
jgi:uncharacterized damage-inducible protein DinB